MFASGACPYQIIMLRTEHTHHVRRAADPLMGNSQLVDALIADLERKTVPTVNVVVVQALPVNRLQAFSVGTIVAVRRVACLPLLTLDSRLASFVPLWHSGTSRSIRWQLHRAKGLRWLARPSRLSDQHEGLTSFFRSPVVGFARKGRIKVGILV